MKLLLSIICLTSFISCAGPSIREQKLRCVERFLEQGVDAEKAKVVCQWGFEAK